MRSQSAIARLYTERALRLIRLGNGQSAEVRSQLDKIAQDLRWLLAEKDLTSLSRRELSALLKNVEALIDKRFSAVSAQQLESVADLAVIEAAWAKEVSGFGRALSAESLSAIAADVLIFGVPLAAMWAQQRDDLRRRMTGAIRDVSAGSAPPDALLTRLLGSGRRGRETGGILQAAMRNADALVHTTVAQVTTDARIPLWKANGVNAFRWHAILDEKTTAGCAIRHGLIYTLDDLEPINHTIPIERRPPRHYRCRSILLPMAYTGKLPAPTDGGQSTFREYFDSLTEAEQDRLFGDGRANLFRRGVITQTDLVGQYGQVLSLDELRLATTPETQIALWWRKPYAPLVAGRVPDAVQRSIGAISPDVVMTSYFRKKQLANHPEISAEAYTRLSSLIRSPRVAVKKGQNDVLIVDHGDQTFIVVLRPDSHGKILVRSLHQIRSKELHQLRTLEPIYGSW